MAKTSTPQEQQHPQYKKDRKTVDILLAVKENPSDRDLAELARLRIRYTGFPGAQDIQNALNELLVNWQLTEDELFAQTRKIHEIAHVYRSRIEDQEDWI